MSKLIHTMLAPIAATALAVPLLAGPATASPEAGSAPPESGSLRIPEPTGHAPVATSTLHLTDDSRSDPWVSDSKNRELMVSMYYPTWLPGGQPSQYATPAESKAFLDGQRDQGAPIPDDLPDGILSKVVTNANTGNLPAVRPGGRPLVVLSPGFSLSRSSLTGLATELASKGYIVAVVDHTHESFGIELPGGRLAPCAACDIEDYSKVPRVRKHDISFVLDRLLSKRPAWRYGWAIDRDRIGIAGHSIGGNSAAATMEADARVDAAVNMDGTFYEPVHGKLDRPVMLLGAHDMHKPSGEDTSWPRDWKRFTGPKYWLTVANSGHFSFIDYPALTEQLGIEDPSPLTGRRAMEITRTYVSAFFDQHLRGQDRQLLDGPSPRFEEVAFHRP